MNPERTLGPDPAEDHSYCRECGEYVETPNRTVCRECIDIYRSEQNED